MSLARLQWSAPYQPSGFRATYRFGHINHCPGCGQTQWHLGRSSAQCAFCATAVPFASHPEARAA
ncbi:hypothetical protein FM036_32785 [Nostoc sp. HG1]|nr:hypothetical protein [Nostoc sp. HG1]